MWLRWWQPPAGQDGDSRAKWLWRIKSGVAFNGITGYKPTATRVPLDGIVPLAFSLDSAGPLGRSVTCCALTDAIMAGEIPAPPVARAPVPPRAESTAPVVAMNAPHVM